MAYGEFARYYDALNTAADYDALAAYVTAELAAHGVRDGILADLGCGTGELTLRLAAAGYDVIGIDRSQEMLSVLRAKMDEGGQTGILLLCQDILALDLYGTVRAVTASFDTLNHIGPAETFRQAVARAGFFMEKGGVFVFDLNTPYKHAQVLADNTFTLAKAGAVCRWHNRCDAAQGRVELSLTVTDTATGETFAEQFAEYAYPMELVEQALQAAGFALAKAADGEDFGPVRPDSQRWIFTAVKRYTQEGHA